MAKTSLDAVVAERTALKTLDKFGNAEMASIKREDFKALDNKAADTNIKTITTQGKNLRALVHKTAVGILMHYAATGDYTKFTPLMSAIRIAYGSNLLKAFQSWVITYSALQYDDKAVNPTGDTRVKGNFVHVKNNGKPNLIEEAIETSMFEMERAPSDPRPVDFTSLIQSMITKIKDAMSEGRLVNDNGAAEELIMFAHEHGLYKTDEELEAEKAAKKEADKNAKATAESAKRPVANRKPKAAAKEAQAAAN